MKEHQDFMKRALIQAQKAAEMGEIPVGAIIVKTGSIIAETHNLVEFNKNSNAHAEILAINQACSVLNEKYLTDCTLYVTLEPCVMCTGALVWSKIGTIVYGAQDAKVGACGSRYQLAQDVASNHHIKLISGILEFECEQLLKSFFQKLRA